MHFMKSFYLENATHISKDYALQRFLIAQAPTYHTVLAELRTGRKSTHWIWFIFPQIAGLGHSAMAQQFAITSLDEAKAYLQHPVLGQRLRECTQLILNVEGRSAEEIFSYPDNLKFRSCMTLFLTASTDNALFKDALLKYFDGKPDQLTMNVLARHNMPRC
jgi:uncharacterized protein (DUF1810 family)